MAWQLLEGDCLEVMRTLPADSVDAIVTDPPYGLEFMGKEWDHGIPGEPFWREALRVAKPGAHLLAFGGTRTYHRLACAIEDAGFEVRDMIGWCYGSGFPKSLDVSKAIDKAAGAEREITGKRTDGRYAYAGTDITGGRFIGGEAGTRQIGMITSPATDAAREWQGWGTALKPAHEPICVARKPLSEPTVAANVLKWGTGAMNIDGCRVGMDVRPLLEHTGRNGNVYGPGLEGSRAIGSTTQGRWPANLIHDGSDEVVGLFPLTPSTGRPSSRGAKSGGVFGFGGADRSSNQHYDSGSAARFFYCAKAGRRERDAGLEHLVPKSVAHGGHENEEEDWLSKKMRGTYHNGHPTVKPLSLMRYLCRLVTPPGGVVLDPFAGSGTTGCAAVLEGFSFIGIEKEPEYVEIARARITHWEMKAKKEQKRQIGALF